MKRGIVVFVEDKKNLLLQFGCLYTSLKYIRAKDTELIVFGTREALQKLPDDCIKYEYKPLAVPPEFASYPFINSLSCLISKEGMFLNHYDYLLRSDVDTFLTPSWNHFYPENYTVGKGNYVFTDEVKNCLKRVSRKLGLNHRGLYNLGSTHYGKPEQVREVCRLAVSIAEYLLTQEFKHSEGVWPSWYRGVTTMYSCEIALNHLVRDIQQEPEKLDYDSTSPSSTKLHPHIHCWHTDMTFSKFQFIQGKYDHIRKKDLNLDHVHDYCLYIALLSKESGWIPSI